MKFISFIAGTAIILAGGAGQTDAPLSGLTTSAQDGVHVMSMPDVARY